MKRNLLNAAALLLMTSMGLIGCASVAESNTHDMTRDLSHAGFKKLEADTPEKLTHLKSLEQLELNSLHRDGKLYYYYADAIYSKTFYIGKEANYQKYEGISSPENVAELHHDQAVNEAVNLNMAATENWAAWGAWGPWGAWW